jgi:membrane protein required for colicin V production
MTGVDILILIILIGGGIIGAIVGLYRALVGIASVIVAILCAGRFYTQLGELLSRISLPQEIARICSFTLIFAVVCSVAIVLGILSYRLVIMFSLGIVDKIGGAILGIIAGLFLVSICVVLLTKYPFANSPQLIANSKLTPFCIGAVKLILKLLPEEFTSVLHQLEGKEGQSSLIEKVVGEWTV